MICEAMRILLGNQIAAARAHVLEAARIAAQAGDVFDAEQAVIASATVGEAYRALELGNDHWAAVKVGQVAAWLMHSGVPWQRPAREERWSHYCRDCGALDAHFRNCPEMRRRRGAR